MSKIKHIKPLQKVDPKATYLLLISPEQIPHLAIVQNNAYYSLTHKKAIVGESFRPYLGFLKRANRTMLFLELVQPKANLDNVFDSFTKVDTKQITCLLPVKESLLPQSTAEFIYELIPELYAEDLIKDAFALNMEDQINQNGEFELVQYTKEAIFDYIQSLNEKHVKREESIS